MADNTFLIRLGLNTQELVNGVNRANGILNNLQRSVTSLAASFSVVQVAKFGLDISRLAGEAEGVKEAFDRLPASIQLMMDLKKATGGTVSELELMKRSVMASNFDISLKALPQLLEFATLRARQTGQSVNYLVDSIVTGIGRKSKLILDNLGISAVQLTEALGGASAASSSIGEVAEAVGRIASKNLETMGKLSENAATKMDRLAASWENFKVSLGNDANGTGFLGQQTQMFTDMFNVLSSENLTKLEKFNYFLSFDPATVRKDVALTLQKAAEQTQKLGEATSTASYFMNLYNNDLEKIKEALTGAADETMVLAEVNRLLVEDKKKQDSLVRNEKNLTEELNNLRDEATLAVGAERLAINLKIQALEKEIEKLRELGRLQKQPVYDASKFASVAPEVSTDATDYITTGVFGGIADVAVWQEELDKVNAEIEESTMLGDAFRETWAKNAEQMTKNANAVAMVGDSVGQMIGGLMSGTEDYAKSMARMAGSVVASLERVALAYMIENSAKFGLPGIAMAAVGFGVIKSLFNQIDGGGGSASSSGAIRPRAADSPGVVQHEFYISGDTLRTFNRRSSYTSSKIGG